MKVGRSLGYIGICPPGTRASLRDDSGGEDK